MTQWSPGGLNSPQQLFQSVQPAQPVSQPAQPMLSPEQLSALAAPPAVPPDHFSGVSRLLSQQGRLPAQPLTLKPSTPQRAVTLPAPPAVALPALQPKAIFPLAPVVTPTRRPLENTFTYQFGEIGKNGSRMEAQGNCGPASAAIVIEEFGVKSPTMRALRKEVGAPTGTRQRAYALTADQVGKAVTKTLEDHNINVKYDIHPLSTNVDRTLEAIQERLDAGEKVVLLSSNLATQSRGHYVVVKEVRSNGSIVIDDPGRRNGQDDVYSKRRLEQTLKTRANRYGMPNRLISFREV